MQGSDDMRLRKNFAKTNYFNFFFILIGWLISGIAYRVVFITVLL